MAAAQTVAFPSSQEGYHIQGRIGRGAFASVYKAYCTNKDAVVAIKVIELEAKDSHDDVNYVFEKVRNESTTMLQLRHHNIVSSLACFIFETEVWIVMPMLVVSCADVLKADYPNGLDNEKMLARILFDVVTGLEYLHRQNLIHRDVKCGNILLTDGGVAQIADFGVSGSLVEVLERQNRLTVTGTPCWMAPEVAENTNPHDAKADIWSLGITAIELINGKPPYSNLTAVNAMMKILTDVAPSVDKFVKKSYTKHFKNFIDACLHKQPKKRKTAKELKAMPLFKNTILHKELAQILGISDGKNPYEKEISHLSFPQSLDNKLQDKAKEPSPFVFTIETKDTIRSEIEKAHELFKVTVNQFVEAHHQDEWTLGIIRAKKETTFDVLIKEGNTILTTGGNNLRTVWVQDKVYDPCLKEIEKFGITPEEFRSFLLDAGTKNKEVALVKDTLGTNDNRDAIDSLISKVVVWRVRSKESLASISPAKTRGRFTEIDNGEEKSH